jgi:choline kinase
MRDNPIRTAVILAAGQGLRLRPLTDQRPKCLVEVNGLSLLSRQVESLEAAGFERLVLVTGYESERVMRHVARLGTSLDVVFVHNEQYATTNNVFSLWLVRKHVDEGFVLVESDLLFEPESMSAFRYPNRIALDRYQPDIHNGTTVELSESGTVSCMHVATPPGTWGADLFKTVNITSLSDETWARLHHHLDMIVSSGSTGVYYETALKTLIEEDGFRFDSVDFSTYWWDEIDTAEDLARVEHRMMAPYAEAR